MQEDGRGRDRELPGGRRAEANARARQLRAARNAERQDDGGRGDSLYGLYEGTPGVEYGADWVQLPNKISLFRLPLEEDFADPAELADEVRRTVVHELAHHAGLDDSRLHGLGFD